MYFFFYNTGQIYHHSDQSRSSSNAGMVMFDTPEIDSDNDVSDNAPYMGKVLSRPVTLKQLLATIKQPGYLETEFRKLPPNHVEPSEIPPGAEKKNRYSNVLPCLRTRAPLGIQGNLVTSLNSRVSLHISTKFNRFVAKLYSLKHDKKSSQSVVDIKYTICIRV